MDDGAKQVKLIFKHRDCVTIDVDSTICRDETIDELAKFCGKEDAIIPITTLAMEGHLDFYTSLVKSLQILDITSEKLKELVLREKSIQYSRNVKKFIKLLQNGSIAVYLINSRQHRHRLEHSPRKQVIKNLKCRFNYKSVVHIGNGMNDAKVCPVADAFVGYGGVVIRQKVKKLAGWFVTDFQQLIDEMMK
ncbi:hypothetical protein HELRODRAFT_192663 [Helobdella robusta]|uniref:Phosphoserine phosphatase n=1 Tax=Helobdella robusta TaxID=6412 RepID=T1FU61_HELRO|nr:hypothetical protein HELRODRAFT_192663 [Helobdella robusta]ESN99946.1 hypothetical protein HELRODRAFT_192663 [Helobdella robusta]